VTIADLPDFIREHYEIYEWRHASAVLVKDFPNEWADLVAVLSDYRLKRSHIAVGGGNKSNVARALDSAFLERGWTARQFDTEIVVDGTGTQSPTHEIDEYKNRVAVEVEWNNKDPFFDRDLNNFRLLFELRVVSVGVIITRADELQEIFDALHRGSSYGESTTHIRKLLPKLEGGGGGGCPILVFGITKKLYQEDA
jgi:hypothetical protein